MFPQTPPPQWVEPPMPTAPSPCCGGKPPKPQQHQAALKLGPGKIRSWPLQQPDQHLPVCAQCFSPKGQKMPSNPAVVGTHPWQSPPALGPHCSQATHGPHIPSFSSAREPKHPATWAPWLRAPEYPGVRLLAPLRQPRVAGTHCAVSVAHSRLPGGLYLPSPPKTTYLSWSRQAGQGRGGHLAVPPPAAATTVPGAAQLGLLFF